MNLDDIRKKHLEAKQKGLPVAGITASNIDDLFAEILRLEAEVNSEQARTLAVLQDLEKVYGYMQEVVVSSRHRAAK